MYKWGARETVGTWAFSQWGEQVKSRLNGSTLPEGGSRRTGQKVLLSVRLTLLSSPASQAVAAYTKAAGMGKVQEEVGKKLWRRRDRGKTARPRSCWLPYGKDNTQTRAFKALTQAPGVRTLQAQMFSLRLVRPRVKLRKIPLTPIWL